MDELWRNGLLAALAVCACAWGFIAARDFGRVRWWRAGLFVLSLATTLAVLIGRLDQLGQDGLLSAHITQHIALADIAAPLLVLSIPPRQRRAVLATRTGAFMGRPAVALAVWAGLIYAWLIPAAHRAAVPGGAWHEADHLTFLAAGVLIWMVVFDPRPARPLRHAARTGALPWWARHLYAIGSRALLLPAVIMLWASPNDRYHVPGSWTFDDSQTHDQANAASIMLGFEMMLFTFAVILVFILVAIREGDRPQIT